MKVCIYLNNIVNAVPLVETIQGNQVANLQYDFGDGNIDVYSEGMLEIVKARSIFKTMGMMRELSERDDVRVEGIEARWWLIGETNPNSLEAILSGSSEAISLEASGFSETIRKITKPEEPSEVIGLEYAANLVQRTTGNRVKMVFTFTKLWSDDLATRWALTHAYDNADSLKEFAYETYDSDNVVSMIRKSIGQ